MTGGPVVEDYLDALVAGPRRDVLRIGLAVPSSGVLGLTGPAGLAAAVLAAEEANAMGILRGRQLRLVPIDAGQRSAQLASTVGTLIDAGALDAVCGFHTSDVHRQLEHLVTGRVPYLFTPPHEGGARLPGVGLLGESPQEQLLPVVHNLASLPALRRWALIGNDYIWPRAVHEAARVMLPQAGAEVVYAELVPFQQVQPERLLDRLRQHRVQAVLLSLVGRDLATLNRHFLNSAMAGTVVRVSGALEETGLLEIDGDDTGELYATMRWFATDPEDREFQGRYAERWGTTAPRLGVYAQGAYHGIHTMARLAAADQLSVGGLAEGLRRLLRRPRAHLARAEGLDLHAIA